MQPVVYAFIFVRGGSKGLPRKNLRLLGDKPLVAHAIETARAVKNVERVIVSTDDAAIADIARQWGAEVPFMRSAELAADNTPEWKAWQHALRAVGCTENGGPCDIFVSVPATTPLRTAADVERCLELFQTRECDVALLTTPASCHPMFSMVVENAAGELTLAMPPQQSIARRQDAPPMYTLTSGAYVLRPSYILTHSYLFEGRVRHVPLPRERAVDIDDALDFAFAEFLLSQQLSAGLCPCVANND